MEIKLSNMQMSALEELGNIGSAHAAIALSQLIDKKILMTVTKVKLLGLEEFIDILGKDIEVIGIYSRVLVELKAGIILVFSKDSGLNLVDVLLNQPLGTSKVIDDIQESALKEAGSILSSAYINSLSELIKTTLIPSVPKIIIDKADVVMLTIFGQLLKEANILLAIETEFIENDNKIKGYFLLVPGERGIQTLLKGLEVKE